jgi:hypothetical protein
LAAAQAGCSFHGRGGTGGSSISGLPDHCHTLAAGQPILALFGAKAGGYVDVFMDAVSWASADKLLADLTSDQADRP